MTDEPLVRTSVYNVDVDISVLIEKKRGDQLGRRQMDNLEGMSFMRCRGHTFQIVIFLLLQSFTIFTLFFDQFKRLPNFFVR